MGFNTFPVWLVGVEGNNPYVAVALSIAALVVTWFLLVGLALAGSGRRRRTSGAFGGGLVGPGAGAGGPGSTGADEPLGAIS
jgi:hypothetical protein